MPEVDGLRFVAIVSVALFHLMGEVLTRAHHVVAVQPRYDLLVQLVGNGDRGVRLFFVLSGYILARPFFASIDRVAREFRCRSIICEG